MPGDFQDVGRFWGCWGDARPVWRFVSGVGFTALTTATAAISYFRLRWETIDDVERWQKKPYPSCTMWGGSACLDDLLSEWVPF